MNQKPPIPSREIFHREFAGIIIASDFNTDYPTGCGYRQRTSAERRGMSYSSLLRKYN